MIMNRCCCYRLTGVVFGYANSNNARDFTRLQCNQMLRLIDGYVGVTLSCGACNIHTHRTTYSYMQNLISVIQVQLYTVRVPACTLGMLFSYFVLMYFYSSVRLSTAMKMCFSKQSAIFKLLGTQLFKGPMLSETELQLFWPVFFVIPMNLVYCLRQKFDT